MKCFAILSSIGFSKKTVLSFVTTVLGFGSYLSGFGSSILIIFQDFHKSNFFCLQKFCVNFCVNFCVIFSVFKLLKSVKIFKIQRIFLICKHCKIKIQKFSKKINLIIFRVFLRPVNSFVLSFTDFALLIA